MAADKSSASAKGPPRPAADLLLAQRAPAQEILRRAGVETGLAARLLVDALRSVESPFGLVPSAGHRWLKTLRRSCRQLEASAATAEQGPPASFDEAIRDALDQLAAQQRREQEESRQGPRLLGELEYSLADPAGPDLPRRFVTAGFVDLLLTTSKGCWTTSPLRALNLASWGHRLAGELAGDRYGITRVIDLQAMAAAYRGNVHRILGQFDSADGDFAEADRLVAQGSQHPRARAELLSYLASLRRQQERFDDAKRLLVQAAAIYRWLQDPHAEGRVLVQKAMTLSSSDDPEGAIEVVRHAVTLIDGEREPRLLLVARHNLATYLRDCGLTDQLDALLRELRGEVDRHGTTLDRLRLQWLEGEAALTAGDNRRGEALLRAARDGFIAENIGFEAAQVCLDLAILYLREGRTGEARSLAVEMVPIFTSSGLHQDATMALLMLQKALEMETATLRWVQEIQSRMARLQDGPAAPSETPS